MCQVGINANDPVDIETANKLRSAEALRKLPRMLTIPMENLPLHTE